MLSCLQIFAKFKIQPLSRTMYVEQEMHSTSGGVSETMLMQKNTILSNLRFYYGHFETFTYM